MAKMMDVLEKMVRGELPPPPIGRLIGMRLVAVRPGESEFEMEATEAHWNPMGTLHGGVLCDLADGALGIAFASTLEEGESFTTLELKINFLKVVRKTRLRAVGRLVRRGKTVGLTECDVFNTEGELVARASSTCMVLRGEQARDR